MSTHINIHTRTAWYDDTGHELATATEDGVYVHHMRWLPPDLLIELDKQIHGDLRPMHEWQVKNGIVCCNGYVVYAHDHIVNPSWIANTPGVMRGVGLLLKGWLA